MNCNAEVKMRELALKSYQPQAWGTHSSTTYVPDAINQVDDRFFVTSAHWYRDFPNGANSTSGFDIAASNNLVGWVGQSASMSSRIGNTINVKKLTTYLTLTANYNRVMALESYTYKPSAGDTNYQQWLPGLPAQGGEALVEKKDEDNFCCSISFIRTDYRVVVVKDLQVNSEVTEVQWNEVFEYDSGTNVSSPCGPASFVKKSELGRFIILYDQWVHLNAKDPQRVLQIDIDGSRIGTVRYNADGLTAKSNVGIYIIWASVSSGVAGFHPLDFPNEPTKGKHNIGYVNPSLASRLEWTE